MNTPHDRLRAARAEAERELAAWHQRGRQAAIERLSWPDVAALAGYKLPQQLRDKHRLRAAWLAHDTALIDARADQIGAYISGVAAVRAEVLAGDAPAA